MPTVTNAKNIKPTSIQEGKKHLILCEGNDDEQFFNCYLKSAAFSGHDVSAVQVVQFCGKDNLRNFLRSLANAESFSQLESLLIVRDADTNIISARDSVKGAFEAINLHAPTAEYEWNCDGSIKTGFLLMPSCNDKSQTGALEDLCWKILSDKFGVSTCTDVERFIDSLEQSGKRTYTHKNKAFVHTYFSSTDELIAASIGRAAQAGAFDWASPELDTLHDFIVGMLTNHS